MNIVVADSSVVVPWLFPEQTDPRALRLLKAVEGASVGCLAPELLRTEFANVAWKKYQRGLCSAEHVKVQTDLFLRMPIEFVESVSILPEALALACPSAHSVYDCMYLAVAKLGGVALATLDDKLASVARELGIPVWE